jgi:hypothetical protein
MKLFHLTRTRFSFILVLVTASFLAGSLPAFYSVGAASSASPVTTVVSHIENYADLTPTQEPTSLAPPVPISADTTGIIVLAIVIVIIVLFGASQGLIRGNKKKST